MDILVGCEFSGVLRRALNAIPGVHAMSCDLLPSEDGEQAMHYQGDVRDVLGWGWDGAVFFPSCTYLCSSGLHWNKRRPERAAMTEEALEFVRLLMGCGIPRWGLENPIGCIGTRIRPADQVIQPWMFGEDASKQTCLWLQGLPQLRPTRVVAPRGWQVVKFAADMPLCDCCEEAWCVEHDDHFGDCSCLGPTQDGVTYRTINGVEFGTLADPAPRPLWANQTKSGQNKLSPSPTRWMDRSRTYAGVAAAMAAQWVAAIEAARAGWRQQSLFERPIVQEWADSV